MAGDDVEFKIVADDESAAVLEKAQSNVKAVGTEAEKAAPKVKGLGDRLGDLGTRTDRARPGMEKYGQGLDSVGNRFDEMDTRAMGTADGITGVSELMRHGELSAAELAMAFSDVGSSMYNTVIPTLKGAKEGFGQFVQSVTGAKTTLGGFGRAAVVAGGAAGLGLLVNALIDAENKAKALEIEKLTEDFMGLGAAVKVADISPVGLLRGDLDKVFDNLLEKSPRLAEDMIAWGEKVGITSGKLDEWRERLNSASDAQEGLAEATERGKTNMELAAEATDKFNDTLDKLLGKSFSVAEAESNLTLAISEATEQVKANKEEHGAAALSLDRHTEAGANNHLMIQGLVESEADYIRALQESGISNTELGQKINQSVLTLEGQLLKLGFTKDQVRVYTAALRAVPSTIRTNIGTRGVQQSIHDIDRIRRELDALDGKSAHIRIVGTQVGAVLPGGARVNAHGGIIGAATGGIHSSMRLVGEHGPELVSLPTGSMVHSNPDTQRMIAGSGGGAPGAIINIHGHVYGVDGLLDVIRDGLRNAGYGADVQAGLGFTRR